MVTVTLSSERIFAQMMGVIGHLKQSVMRDNPMHFLADIGFEQSCCELGVIHGRQLITNVVHESSYNPFCISTVVLCTGCRLQGVLQSIYFVSSKAAFQSLQRFQNTARQTQNVLPFMAIKQAVIR